MDVEGLRELFAPFGAVEIKRLFSGHGVYADSLCFAVEMRGEIRMRGDVEAGPLYEAAGSRPWIYERANGHKGSMPYWTLPESALDDEGELLSWCHVALAAARRAAAAKAAKAPRQSIAAKRKAGARRSVP